MSASSVPVSRRQFLAGTAASCLVPATSLAEEPRPANRGGETTAVSGTRGAVATVHPLASQAALQTLQAGGNAADAAVAAALMLAVVDGHNSGLGGGCFILARAPDGQILAIDGREMAPAAAHRQMFFQGGEPVPARSQVGPLASGVPGAVAAYHALSQRLGTGRWSEAVAGAAEVAAAGVPVSAAMAARLAGVQESIRRFPATAQLFLRPDGAPLQAGDRLVQTDLARTLRELAAGPEAFYQGSFAERTDAWMRAHGGLITAADLAAYRTVDRQPVESGFAGHRVAGFPPPSSGGIHVAQILTMLERFDLASLAAEQPATFYHVVAEAMRRAFADRARWLGDPDFSHVPQGLVDEAYLRRRAASIDPGRTSPGIAAGLPPEVEAQWFGQQAAAERHTTHLTAVDAAGHWIAITSTINTTLGSKVVIPGTGVVLNNEMDDFAIAPGIPNAFGLVGREANVPEAGKRPLSSMSPTLVSRDGIPVLTCGAAGGPRIISAVAQLILRVVGLQQGLPAAMQAPRVHHQWRPDRLLVEQRLPAEVVAGLRQRGHEVERRRAVATAQAIVRLPSGELTAVAEPRIEGATAAAF